MRSASRNRRHWPLPEPQDEGPVAPAVAALTELVQAECERVAMEESELAEQADPGRVWLLWFAIGATDAACELVGCHLNEQRNEVFRQVVGVIFNGHGLRPGTSPIDSDKRLIELFESAGSEAVAACMRGDRKLGYYLEALRVSSRKEIGDNPAFGQTGRAPF
jgi:hypothetical protein